MKAKALVVTRRPCQFNQSLMGRKRERERGTGGYWRGMRGGNEGEGIKSHRLPARK